MSCLRCNNTNCTCSEKGAGYNIIGNGLKNYKLQSPIPDEVRDITKISNWFKNQRYIPYAGTTFDSNHTYLKYLLKLSKLSPTLASCINGIKYYAFTGKPNIIKSVDSEFDFTDTLNSEELSLEAKKSFTQKLSLIDKGNVSWTDLATNLYNSYKSCGNAYLSIQIKKILGQPQIKFTFHEPETVLYKMPDLFTSDKVDVSLSWDTKYLSKFPAKTYSVFPYFDENKDKTEISTMIHLKAGTGHYGRPDWFACSHDAFLEIKNKEYLLKAVHNNFTGQVLIEFEGMNDTPIIDDQRAKDNGWKNTADQWAGNFTNAGGSRETNSQSVLISERPAGASPALVHEFQIQTKEEYFIKIGNDVEKNIIKVNMWSKNLSGIDNPSGFSTDAFMNELKTKLPIIKHYQSRIDNQINTALDFVGQQLEDIEFIENNIVHKGIAENIINELSKTPTPDAKPINTL